MPRRNRDELGDSLKESEEIKKNKPKDTSTTPVPALWAYIRKWTRRLNINGAEKH
jgi:hypothetical protein